jgi:hypothetical protein
MRYQMLDTIVLTIDLPEYGLRAGDIGEVIEQYDDEGVEVEIVTGAGTTQALLRLPIDHVASLWRRKSRPCACWGARPSPDATPSRL